MFVNLTEVFTIEGKQVTMQAESELEQVTIGNAVFPVKDKAPVNLSFTNIGKGKVRIVGDAKITFAMNCDRCLKPVEQPLMLQFDSKGICRQCGRDLNTGTCDCDTFVPDPRMAVIKDIFNGNKEV